MSNNDNTNSDAFKPKAKKVKEIKMRRSKNGVRSAPLRFFQWQDYLPINQNELVIIHGIIDRVSQVTNIHPKIMKRIVTVKMGVTHVQDLTVVQFDHAVKFLATFCDEDKAWAHTIQKGAKP